MYLKMASAKWRLFHLGLNEFTLLTLTIVLDLSCGTILGKVIIEHGSDGRVIVLHTNLSSDLQLPGVLDRIHTELPDGGHQLGRQLVLR